MSKLYDKHLFFVSKGLNWDNMPEERKYRSFNHEKSNRYARLHVGSNRYVKRIVKYSEFTEIYNN